MKDNAAIGINWRRQRFSDGSHEGTDLQAWARNPHNTLNCHSCNAQPMTYPTRNFGSIGPASVSLNSIRCKLVAVSDWLSLAMASPRTIHPRYTNIYIYTYIHTYTYIPNINHSKCIKGRLLPLTKRAGRGGTIPCTRRICYHYIMALFTQGSDI